MKKANQRTLATLVLAAFAVSAAAFAGDMPAATNNFANNTAPAAVPVSATGQAPAAAPAAAMPAQSQSQLMTSSAMEESEAPAHTVKKYKKKKKAKKSKKGKKSKKSKKTKKASHKTKHSRRKRSHTPAATPVENSGMGTDPGNMSTTQ
jgi:hypothetical protein